MAETQLNKEFKKEDVQRLRNLIQGKYNDSVRTGVGYSKKKEFYSEGDIWVEDGRKWTIKNGIKQNITKLDSAKKANLMPLFCPKCSNLMKGQNDKSFYNIHKMCFNCVIDFEHQLKLEGKFEQYLIDIHNSQIDAQIKEFTNWLENEKLEKNNSYITENGDIEEWLGGNIDNLENEINNAIKFLETLKK